LALLLITVRQDQSSFSGWEFPSGIFFNVSSFRSTAENESLIWKHLPLFGFQNALADLMYQMFDRPHGLRYNSLAIKEKNMMAGVVACRNVPVFQSV
jgi:hypothetical protein